MSFALDHKHVRTILGDGFGERGARKACDDDDLLILDHDIPGLDLVTYTLARPRAQ